MHNRSIHRHAAGAGRRPGTTSQTLTISPPTTLKEIDTDKAQPSRMAWSPDGSERTQTFEGTFLELNQGRGTRMRHYVIAATDGAKGRFHRTRLGT
jgi:hypothetical protein